VTDFEQDDLDLPLSHLAPPAKAKRAASFGEVASQYERYRPGPPAAAVEWVLPDHVERVVDLGAGTGALTRLLLGKADEVVAVEPDDRMRSVLVDQIPAARAVAGRGESIPLPDASVDAVLASASWHWMDLVPTLEEVARVLVPGGVLAAMWSGPDPDGGFLVQAQALLAEQGRRDGGRPEEPLPEGTSAADVPEADLAALVLGDSRRPNPRLEIPPGVPFAQPEHEVFAWDIALNADELIGLLGTFSWIITMPEDLRLRVLAEARRLLREFLGLEGTATIEVAYQAEVWRSRRA
jgi:SAM-dependent methyltransferase